MDLKNKIIISKGDITELKVDAIVNAANTDLKLGAGVAGAIRKNGGDSIQRECDKIGSISLGEAVMTGAGNLKSKFVIHAAGMRPGAGVTEESLNESTLNSLKRAEENGIKTIAFPAIGTGVGGLSADICAEVMINAVINHVGIAGSLIERVYFVLFDDRTYEIFSNKQESLLKVLNTGKTNEKRLV